MFCIRKRKGGNGVIKAKKQYRSESLKSVKIYMLGALQDFGQSSADANTIRKQGTYYNTNTMSNMPTISGTDYFAGWGVLFHFNGGSFMIQFYIGGSNNPGQAFFVRHGAISTGVWQEWLEIKRWF